MGDAENSWLQLIVRVPEPPPPREKGGARVRLPRTPTGYKGVYYDKRRRKFAAGIKINGITLHLGRFDTPGEAAAAYDAAAVAHGWPRAGLNGAKL